MRCANKKCEDLVKPNITFFGEGLPSDFFKCLQRVGKCDLLIIIGSDLAVGPFNQIVKMISDDVSKVLINLENTKEAGFDFDNSEKYPNRIFLEGKCDDVVQELAEQCGWREELQRLMGRKFEESKNLEDIIAELELGNKSKL